MGVGDGARPGVEEVMWWSRVASLRRWLSCRDFEEGEGGSCADTWREKPGRGPEQGGAGRMERKEEGLRLEGSERKRRGGQRDRGMGCMP